MTRAELFDAEKLPTITDDEVEAVEHALAVYRDAPAGTNPRQVNKMMAKLALGYPSQKISTDEAEARIELYSEQLADIPVDILGAGFAAAVRTLKFFPSVSELRELAMKQPAPPRIVHQHRLQLLLDAHRNAVPAIEPLLPEEMSAIMAEYGLTSMDPADLITRPRPEPGLPTDDVIAELIATAIPVPPPPAPPVKPPSEEDRALLRRVHGLDAIEEAILAEPQEAKVA